MLLLLGFIALACSAAAILSLLYLLLAPAAVLAPALGEAGRALFRGWAARLLGAVMSKLIFSFLLGVVLASCAVLRDLTALGWWTQWLLISAIWWGAYLPAPSAARRCQRGRADARRSTEHAPVARSAGRSAACSRRREQACAAARWARRRLSKPPPDAPRPARVARAGRAARHAPRADEQVARALESEHRDASARAGATPRVSAR